MKITKNKWGDIGIYLRRMTIRWIKQVEGFTPDPFTIIIARRKHVFSIHRWKRGEGHKRPYK